MSLVIGVLLIAVAVLAMAGMAIVCRKPDPPGWTRSFVLVELITVSIVGLLATGAIEAVTFFLVEQPVFGTREAGLLAAIIAIFCLAWRRLKVRSTLKSYAAGAGPVVANLNVGPPPAVSPGTSGKGRSQRKRAA